MAWVARWSSTVRGKVGRGVLDMVMLLSTSNKVWQSCSCKSVSRLEKQLGMSMMMMDVGSSVPTSPVPT